MEAFRVDGDTDNLTEEEICEHWDEVNAADRKEIEQFAKEKVCKLRESASLTPPAIDAIWSRKWKRSSDAHGGRIRTIKGRLCARGVLVAQGHELTTRATTESRLSQRLLAALSVTFACDWRHGVSVAHF